MPSAILNPVKSDSLLIYFLAAPQDETVCRDVQKHLSPMVRFPRFPIEMKSDFEISPGWDRDQHKALLLEADIVLALISADFVADDALYHRVEQVIDRSNNRQTAVISILVRNFVWKMLPPVFLPVLPQNQHAISDRRHWPNDDVALAEVVHDVIARIADVAQAQRPAPRPVSRPPAQPNLGRPTVDGDRSRPLPPSEQEHTRTTSPQPSDGGPPVFTGRRRPANTQHRPSHQPTTAKPFTAIPAVPGDGPPAFGRSEPLASPGPASKKTTRPGGDPSQRKTQPGNAPPAFGRKRPPAQQRRTPVQPERVVPPRTAPSSMQTSGTKGEASSGDGDIDIDIDIETFRANLVHANPTIEKDWRPKYYRKVVWRRGFAYLIDSFLLTLVPLLLLGGSEVALNIASAIFVFSAPAFEASPWRGTPGKRLLKLEITHKDGQKISYGRAFLRNILRSLVFWSYIFIVGLIIQYFRFKKTKKLLHDELSTTVIGERQEEQ